jgi:DNA-binding response OmpR family regulator
VISEQLSVTSKQLRHNQLDTDHWLLATGHFLLITVKDTGIGIPAVRLPHIFDRFYQVDSSSTREYEGSGIGLALVKELVELHHGAVTVASEVGKGSTFTVRLPLGKDHLRSEEIIATSVKATRVRAEMELPDFETEPPATSNEQPVTSDETTVLVVEDHADFRHFLRGYLEPIYKVMESANGAEGWETALAHIPDVIISDVMMPKMNGYELCARLKADERTSHIPVLLLTAKAGTADKLEGLQNGADDYLPKPFEPCELQARLKNLIDSRRKLRHCFKQAVILKPSELAVEPAEKVFLAKVLAAVEKHIAREEFGVDTLAAEVAMSRTQLNRKLRALTNQSVKEFIQSTRLQRAAELLRKKAGTVGEVAYQVGFVNHSYFAKCFREQFGKAPSEYVQD